MNRSLLYLLVLEAGFVLEAAIRHLPLATVRVDVAWVLVLYLGFYVEFFPGGLWVLAIGLAQESLGVPFHGILPFSYLIIYSFLRMTHQHLFFQKGTPQVLWVIILTFLQKGIEMGLLFLQGYGLVYQNSMDLLHLALTALVQGLLSLILFPLLKKGDKISPRYAT